jgi:ribosomal protein S18 acetylase RimI-like enzyme
MIEPTITLSDTPPVPGIVFRAFDPAIHYPGLVDLIREAHLRDGIDYLPTVDALRVDYENGAEFDPRRDVLVAADGGTLVAATEIEVRTRDGIGVHQTQGWVRPAWRRRGLGRSLLAWSERRAREVALVDGRPARRALTAWPDDQQVGAIALSEGAGYRAVRFGFLMIRDLGDPIRDMALPEGLEVRPVMPDQHRAIWDADVEAFRDHWDPLERTDADFAGWFAKPELDTSLWQVAWDGDEVAGSVMTFVFENENAELGVSRAWLEHISVRRPWRRRGLASALIGRALVALREGGFDEAALGVDAENPSGALRLYEALGFRRQRVHVAYRKEFTAD